jgi:hypothetical protein
VCFRKTLRNSQNPAIEAISKIGFGFKFEMVSNLVRAIVVQRMQTFFLTWALLGELLAEASGRKPSQRKGCQAMPLAVLSIRCP